MAATATDPKTNGLTTVEWWSEIFQGLCQFFNIGILLEIITTLSPSSSNLCWGMIPFFVFYMDPAIYLSKLAERTYRLYMRCTYGETCSDETLINNSTMLMNITDMLCIVLFTTAIVFFFYPGALFKSLAWMTAMSGCGVNWYTDYYLVKKSLENTPQRSTAQEVRLIRAREEEKLYRYTLTGVATMTILGALTPLVGPFLATLLIGFSKIGGCSLLFINLNRLSIWWEHKKINQQLTTMWRELVTKCTELFKQYSEPAIAAIKQLNDQLCQFIINHMAKTLLPSSNNIQNEPVHTENTCASNANDNKALELT